MTKNTFLPKQLVKKIVEKEVYMNLFENEAYRENGELVKNFIRRCLEKDPEARASAEDLLDDRWITENTENESMDEQQLIDIGWNLYTYKKLTMF